MRTLVISDLHLGSLLERDVLRRPAALAVLEEALPGTDRLVLLGDTLELLEGRPAAAAAAARAVLPRLAAALDPGAEVVVVAGNHDHALVRPWLHDRRAADRPLGPAQQVPRSASETLADLARLLRPARVSVRYPGVWLREDVYAMHGHYLDRLLPAAIRGRLRDPAGGGPQRRRSWDFEAAPGADAGGVSEVLASALPDGLAGGVEQTVGQVRRAMLTGLPVLATVPGWREAAALAALGLEQGVHRRAAIPAMAEVAAQLGLRRARFVVFGHIHRRGPLPSDPAELWAPLGPDGPRLLNSGSWVFDTALAGSGGASGGARPYRPGGAVLVDGDRDPEPLDLLDGIPDRVLRGRV